MKVSFSAIQDKDQYTLICTFGLLQGIKLAFRMYFQVKWHVRKTLKTSGSASENGCLGKTSYCKTVSHAFLETGDMFKCLISSNIRTDFKLVAKPAWFWVVEAMNSVFPKKVCNMIMKQSLYVNDWDTLIKRISQVLQHKLDFVLFQLNMFLT